ncbi:MAG: hypothetical protein E4G99_00330 [Anaerolineales bacterium]|nr:MAG: hypothetical protein E4G99_00330 [Anaerolineales bacterium]
MNDRPWRILSPSRFHGHQSKSLESLEKDLTATAGVELRAAFGQTARLKIPEAQFTTPLENRPDRLFPLWEFRQIDDDSRYVWTRMRGLEPGGRHPAIDRGG